MTDLEDRLLKKNIPGKYSWWDEDYNNERNRVVDDDDSVHDDDEDVVNGHARKPIEKSFEARSSSGKSGVKGVLADYRLHQEEKKRDALIARMKNEEQMERHVLGVNLQPGEVSISMAAMQERNRHEKQSRTTQDDEDEAEEEGDDDDEFLARYHRRRLLELQRTKALPEFEGVEEVDPVGFSVAVDKTDCRVAVVVHLYETYVPACRSLAAILENLSRNSMRGVRFLSLKASSASATLDPLALPSVLLYRAGQLVGNLTPITQHLPSSFTPQHVEDILNETIGIQSAQHIFVESDVRERLAGDTDSDAELDEFCKDFDGTL